jgi:predicted CXXCH cytochrome family protein
LLDEDAGDLCLKCHDSIARVMRLASTHDPAAAGNCLACHDSHASAYPNQLIQPVGELCGACHPAVDTWRTGASVHAPVKNNECLVCHNPHGSENGGLLAEGVPALCFKCHDNDAPFQRAHQGFLACHDPHSSTLAKLIMPNQHAPFKGNKCGTCHETKPGAAGFALVSDIKSLCTRCHSAIRTESEKRYGHNLSDERSCMNCHNAHASAGKSLLSGAQQTLCTGCHFKEDEYAGKPRASILTHDGMDCTNCHTPHGADNARYLKSADVDLCAGCHERAHAASHPIGPEVIDQRTNEPVTCLSCHKLHGADYEPYLPLNPQMDLCIQCHKR